MNVEIKFEIIEKELRRICTQINRFVMCIKETQKNCDNNYISETECVEAKESYTNSLFEWGGRLESILTLLNTGSKYRAICKYDTESGIREIFLLNDNDNDNENCNYSIYKK